MSEQPVIFQCEGDQLLGILHRPEARAKRNLGIVVVVGGPQYRVGSHRQFTLMARAFCDAGYAVLRFDYRGMGDSQGRTRNFEHVDDDIRVAIDMLLKTCPELDGVLLWGLCDAASACLMYANRKDPRVAGLIIANPWVRTVAGEAKAYLKYYYVERLLQKSFWMKLLQGQLNPMRAVRGFLGLFRKSLGEGARQSDMGFVERMYEGLGVSRFPVLLLISEVDLTAKEFLDHCERMPAWRALLNKRGVQQESLPGMDHTFSTQGGVSTVNERCLAWMRQIGQTSP
jgi:exosortase A-associated hydrolase 1